MQQSHYATNSGKLHSQPHTGHAVEVIEELRDILTRVSSPPRDEALCLIGRLVSTPSKDNPPHISKFLSFHRLRRLLYRKPGSTMGELSRSLSVPLYSVTRSVDSLVDIGLVYRHSDPGDRRVVRVTLTDDGLRLHQTFEEHSARNIEKVMACLTAEEQGMLVGLLYKVAASLRDSEGQISSREPL